MDLRRKEGERFGRRKRGIYKIYGHSQFERSHQNAGADVLVAGSYLFKQEKMSLAIKEMKK